MPSSSGLAFLATALATSALACTADVEVDPDVAGSAIDDYIRALPKLPADPPEVREGTASTPERSGDYQCSTTDVSETRQYDRIVAYAANSEAMWPGSLVAGDSVYTGLFTPMVFDRSPLTFSVGLEGLAGRHSATLEAPSLSAYRDALAQILSAEVTGATPANIYSEIEQVHSENQLSLALGVDVSWGLGTASIESSFDWSRQETRSRFLVKFTQAYYTVDLDPPGVPSAVFAPGTTLDDVKSRIDETNPPLYVSSITYGRMVVFTFESEYSNEEMEAALAFAYAGGVDVDGQVSVSYKEMLSKSKITAFILGGSGGDAVRTIDSYDALIDFIKEGGDYSPASPGAPIAYKLAYLADNSPARLSFTTDYQIEECNRVSQKVRVILKAITVADAGGDPGDELELYGSIWAEGVGQLPLFSRGSDDWVQVNQGATWPAGSQIAEGILEVEPRPGQAIRLRAHLSDSDWIGDDDLGDQVTIAPFETGWRKDTDVLLTGDGAQVKISFNLQPI